MDTQERWNRAYVEAPEIFDAFCRAEDPDGRITRVLLDRAGLDGRDVLELGCGTGRYTREWAVRAGTYVALERSPAMLALARRNCAGLERRIGFICGDAGHLPLAAGAIDCVLAGWVVINLRASLRRRVLAEAARVLRGRPGAGIWLVENDAHGEFQRLRGRRAGREEARLRRLVDDWGFTPVEVVETELRFPSPQRAEQVLGWLCGDQVRDRLRDRPTARLTHHVVILHRAAR